MHRRGSAGIRGPHGHRADPGGTTERGGVRPGATAGPGGACPRRAVALARDLAALGHDHAEVADRLGLNPRTLRQWQHDLADHPAAVVPRGRPLADSGAEQQQMVVRWLDEIGPGVGVPRLRLRVPGHGPRRADRLAGVLPRPVAGRAHAGAARAPLAAARQRLGHGLCRGAVADRRPLSVPAGGARPGQRPADCCGGRCGRRPPPWCWPS